MNQRMKGNHCKVSRKDRTDKTKKLGTKTTRRQGHTQETNYTGGIYRHVRDILGHACRRVDDTRVIVMATETRKPREYITYRIHRACSE